MATTYDPRSVEARWYQYWLDGGFFHAQPGGEREPFCIVIPPPNVTGILHMGHALNNTMQDVLVRWHRMRGDNTLWVPGTDHAGIATQARVEKQLAEEGLTRDDLGRDRFLERVWAWKQQYGGTIIEQLKRLGASCDWQRERFTMDEGCSRAVREVFRRLYAKGLIYRGSYIINWCPRCSTTISDIEVEHSEEQGTLTYIRYPGLDGASDIVVATTRPETMLGDTAVAVNPDDGRYRDLVGREVLLPIVNRRLPVIADEAVDPEFGTGAVKVTPAHDPADFEMGRRHHLEEITVIGKDGVMTPEAHQYAGLPALEARQGVVAELQRLGLVVKIEDYSRAVGLRAVVRADEAVGRTGPGGGAPGADPVFPRALHQGLSQLAGEHQRLVHFPPTLVGPPDPSLVLPILRRCHLPRSRSGYLSPVRRRQPGAGPGRAGHLVQFGPLAVFHPGLARPHPGIGVLLPHFSAGHCQRHHLFLGRQDDLHVLRIHAGRAL
jgi:valyl-tRNA synthetase